MGPGPSGVQPALVLVLTDTARKGVATEDVYSSGDSQRSASSMLHPFRRA